MGESLQSRRANRNEDLHGFADFNCRFQVDRLFTTRCSQSRMLGKAVSQHPIASASSGLDVPPAATLSTCV